MQRLALSVFLAAPLLAQAPTAVPADLRFEVASLKPSLPGGRGGGIRPAEGGLRYVANNYPIKGMIMVAYRVKAGPDPGRTAVARLGALTTWRPRPTNLRAPTNSTLC